MKDNDAMPDSHLYIYLDFALQSAAIVAEPREEDRKEKVSLEYVSMCIIYARL